MTEHPRAVNLFIKRFGVGWRHQVIYGTGEMTFGGLSEETDGDGKRTRVSSVETVESVSVRGCHTGGRSMAAVWVKRIGQNWKYDMGWTWTRRASDGLPAVIPQRAKSTELSDYVKDRT